MQKRSITLYRNRGVVNRVKKFNAMDLNSFKPTSKALGFAFLGSLLSLGRTMADPGVVGMGKLIFTFVQVNQSQMGIYGSSN